MKPKMQLMLCPRCCLRYRDPAHVGSDYCKLTVIHRNRRREGLQVCHGNWIRLVRDAGIPLIEDFIRLDFKNKMYERVGIKGYWIPNWVDTFLHKTADKSPNKISRNRRVKYLHVLSDDGVRAEFSAAVRLGNYKGAFVFLDGIIKDEDQANAQIMEK